MVTITQLGNPIVVIPVAIITLGILGWSRQKSAALMFAIACLGGAILNTGLKLIFTKPRPELWSRLIVETSYSYPSGHALGSMVLYGMIAYLLSQQYPKFSSIIYVAAAGLILMISFSRLYLGVHWPTDIIAGLGIGFLWLMVCITMLKLQNLGERTQTRINSQ
jgi:membrane-associated phospholipid phosphatase